jgi:hypothetical protein
MLRRDMLVFGFLGAVAYGSIGYGVWMMSGSEGTSEDPGPPEIVRPHHGADFHNAPVVPPPPSVAPEATGIKG